MAAKRDVAAHTICSVDCQCFTRFYSPRSYYLERDPVMLMERQLMTMREFMVFFDRSTIDAERWLDAADHAEYINCVLYAVKRQESA